MRRMIETQNLQKIQDWFCELTNIFLLCIGENGEKLTHVSGKPQEVERLLDIISVDRLLELYRKVSESTLEDQIIEDTAYSNLKIAAVSVKIEGRPIMCWLACCILSDEEDLFGGPKLEGFTAVNTEDGFYTALDLLGVVSETILQTRSFLQAAEAKRQRSEYSEGEMGQALKRSESMTEMVQLLESREAFEAVGGRILELAASCLEIDQAVLFRVSADEDTVDLIHVWSASGVTNQFERTKGLSRNILLSGDKPLVISADTMISDKVQQEMNRIQAKAVVVMPLYVNGVPAMYACFREGTEPRCWRMEDIKFINDTVKLLQSMLIKRIQQHSLASSYTSLQAILDNVGSAIHVTDKNTGEVLFQNKILKKTFAKEIEDGTLKGVLADVRPPQINDGYFEIHHQISGRWYDLYRTDITWVDDRQVSLFALYDITDKKNYQKKIEQLAYTDFLTGLYNRMCCERDLACQVDMAKAQNISGGLLYLDLDDFKHINDGLGHQYGDALLKAISNNLQRIRGIETTCYRMGGDEFVIVILPKIYPEIERILEEIEQVFARPWYLKDADYYCTMSMGIVTFPDDGDNVQDLIKKADIAMYEAKKSGKNRHAYYSDSISMASNRRLDMEKSMRNATAEGYTEFEVYFQPIIDIQLEGTPCTGAEALIRWNSAILGFIPPSDFIPLAEYLGLINPIGNHVLEQACRACKYWNDNGHPNYKVNVNLSVVQLLQPDIVEIVERTLKETAINPRNLTLEVTENLAINDMKRMKQILSEIRSMGVRIALDDFGTGYSSLNHIREIPLDVIKVDQSFVQGLTEDGYSQSFIRMVGELASAIGVSICIEGIETEEQYKVLENMKVRLVQGYYFDKPMPQSAFEAKYVLAEVKN